METKFSEYVGKNIKYILAAALGVVLLIISSADITTVSGRVSEKELESTLEMAEGVGNVEVMIAYNDDGSAKGAIIVAEGADNPEVRKTIRDCALAVLGVPDHKIQVMSKK